MSGGSFDYNCFLISDFATKLRRKIKNNNKPNEYGDSYGMSSNTLSLLTKSQRIIKTAALLAYQIEWLYSDDIGEEEFAEMFEKIIKRTES